MLVNLNITQKKNAFSCSSTFKLKPNLNLKLEIQNHATRAAKIKTRSHFALRQTFNVAASDPFRWVSRCNA